jgi:streptomycin 6-kinase
VEGNDAPALLRAWGLTVDGPERRTFSGTVVFVRRGTERLVLKVPRPDGDEASAAPVLGHFDGRGAARLVAADGPAHLIERAMPGEPLTSLVLAGRDDEATAIVCAVAARLHDAGRPGFATPTVADWGEGFARYRAGGGSGIPQDLFDRAEQLFHGLAATQGTPTLLHGDLHHDNILRDAHRGWLAIDPKGVLGEPAYEFGALLRNPTEDPRHFADPAIVARRVAIIVNATGLDRARLLGWALAQAVLSSIWSWEDGEFDVRGLPTAQAVVSLL